MALKSSLGCDQNMMFSFSKSLPFCLMHENGISSLVVEKGIAQIQHQPRRQFSSSRMNPWKAGTFVTVSVAPPVLTYSN